MKKNPQFNNQESTGLMIVSYKDYFLSWLLTITINFHNTFTEHEIGQ